MVQIVVLTEEEKVAVLATSDLLVEMVVQRTDLEQAQRVIMQRVSAAAAEEEVLALVLVVVAGLEPLDSSG
jgi:hypothetical protein